MIKLLTQKNGGCETERKNSEVFHLHGQAQNEQRCSKQLYLLLQGRQIFRQPSDIFKININNILTSESNFVPICMKTALLVPTYESTILAANKNVFAIITNYCLQ